MKNKNHAVSRLEFDRYREVQFSGRYNMIMDAAKAQRAARLSTATYMAIINAYDDLEKAYGPYQEGSA